MLWGKVGGSRVCLGCGLVGLESVGLSTCEVMFDVGRVLRCGVKYLCLCVFVGGCCVVRLSTVGLFLVGSDPSGVKYCVVGLRGV